MNDIKQKGISIKLDKERHLSFDLNALCELEEKYETLAKALNVISSSPSMKDIRYILYLALAHEDEELTEKQVGKLITINNVNEVIDALGESLNISLPEVDEDEEKN
jgi:hypothetical protein